MRTNLFTDDLSGLKNDELFEAIVDFATAQPIEGWRHDYTEKWEDAGLKNIAAFANTFGGLLIVGVKKGKKDVACGFPGVETDSEYKTRIASAIAANISPVPSYSIFECHQPGASDRKFCVVQVREGRHLHLITKKDLHPAYVRNEDESRIADATQLRRLIDREKGSAALSDRITVDANRLRDSMLVNRGYKNPDSSTWYLSTHDPSQTFLKLVLMPVEAITIELEQMYEDKIRKFIYELYPRIGDTIFQGAAKHGEGRGADFYEFIYYHRNLDYEIRWRITSTGAIGFAAQMHYQFEGAPNVWSIVDVANYLVLFFRLGMKWWEAIGYFGDGQLFVQLAIHGLDVLRHPNHGYCIQGFNPTISSSGALRFREPLDIRIDAIRFSAPGGNAANAQISFNYFTATEGLPRLVTSVVNQLVRSLGHGANWNLLKESIEYIVRN